LIFKFLWLVLCPCLKIKKIRIIFLSFGTETFRNENLRSMGSNKSPVVQHALTLCY
jgi:hypothetical protein